MAYRASNIFRWTTPASGVASMRALTIERQVHDLGGQVSADARGALNRLMTGVVARFRDTDTGRAVEREATRQKVESIAHRPALWLAAGVVLILVFLGLRALLKR